MHWFVYLAEDTGLTGKVNLQILIIRKNNFLSNRKAYFPCGRQNNCPLKMSMPKCPELVNV